MTAYDNRPWLDLYPEGRPPEIVPDYDDALAMFRASVARGPDRDAIRYFDGRITYQRLDELSDRFALALQDYGLERGDRVALYLQNVPQVVIGIVGTWKAGGIAVSINPMSRERELEYLLDDSGATFLLCLEHLYRDVAGSVVPNTAVHTVFTTSELEYQTRNDPRLLGGARRQVPEGTVPLEAVLDGFAGGSPAPLAINPTDIALLTYTSGTTGPSKAATNTHRNVVFSSQAYREWCSLDPNDVVLGISPLFHITGLIAHLGTSLLVGAPLVLSYRFDPSIVLEAARDEGATFTVGAITAFVALMNDPSASKDHLATLSKIMSGGAPIPPRTLEEFWQRFGQRIHNVYGMTETTSPTHAVPLGTTAPIDQRSNASSIGLPIFNTVARIVGEDGEELPPGTVGELAITGPQVVPGYWNQPDESAHLMRGGVLHTGDVAYMDEDGWFYIVDRKKDQINAGGYKVWPREVEDVLYEHRGVREAAVIGVPDSYRGETVKAFVKLKPDCEVAAAELIAFCKQRLAAYKYPRQVEFIDELPKSATGKILRRELRS
jgi:long-chain acyl-CoA synthetase